MIHWAFLVPVFIAGFIAGYVFLYQMTKAVAQVEGAIKNACRQITM